MRRRKPFKRYWHLFGQQTPSHGREAGQHKHVAGHPELHMPLATAEQRGQCDKGRPLATAQEASRRPQTVRGPFQRPELTFGNTVASEVTLFKGGRMTPHAEMVVSAESGSRVLREGE